MSMEHLNLGEQHLLFEANKNKGGGGKDKTYKITTQTKNLGQGTEEVELTLINDDDGKTGNTVIKIEKTEDK